MKDRDLFGNPVEIRSVAESLESTSPSFSEFPAELENIGVEDENPTKRSLVGFHVAIGVVVIALGFQCFRLQVTSASQNRAAATGNSVRILTEQPDRGLVVDLNGKVLAQNDRRVGIAINPQTLPRKEEERLAVYEKLKSHGAIEEDDMAFLEKNFRKNPELYALKTNLTKEENLLYQEWFTDIPGVVFTELPIRKYSELPSFAHLMGYIGAVSEKDVQNGLAFNQRVGKTGLEKNYNSELTGTPGKIHAEVNASGKVVRFIGGEEGNQTQVGQTLKLNIDSRIQEIVTTALKNELVRRTQKYGPLPKLGASVVIMDPRDGAIRAMVSIPDYSSNLFSQGISRDDYAKLTSDPANPLLNRAIQGQFSPGSTLKPLVASAGLQAGVISADTVMNTPAAITIGQFRFPDWKYHGLTNTRKAIAESNNVFFYVVGGGWEEKNIEGLGVERLNAYLASFGLGKQTGVDLPGETPGLLPDDAWKQEQFDERWYIGNTYQSSIGQGYLLATPLQMAVGTAAIANGGTVWEPRVAKSTINPETNIETPIAPKPARTNIISAANLQTVREGMRQAVLSGSAQPLRSLKVTSAGKTGTAQFGNQGLTHAWFTGFAPYDNPEYVYAILVEGGGESYWSSVPVAEEILRGIFNEPLEPGQKLFSEPTDAKTSSIANEFAGER
jgi:penicillin-binding protein 2